MKRTKRYFSLVLSLLMILTAFVIPSHAQTDSNQDNQVTLIDETFDLGWKGLFDSKKISWIASGGSAQITDSGWNALQIVDADIIKDKDIFTVSVDIQFTTLKSNATTLMGIIYENDASTSNFNIDSGIAMLRSNNAGDLYFLNGGYKNKIAKYLMSDGKTLSGGAGTAANFPQLATYYPDAGNTGYWINLSLTVNKNDQTCTAYLNGIAVNTYTGFTVTNSGLYFLLQQNSGTMVDNLKITGADNSVIYEEDFSSTESGPLPMIREGTSSANGSITQSLTEEALSIKDSGWCIYQLAPLEQLKGALTYTLTAKIRLDTFSANASHIAFRFNQEGEGDVKAGINNASLVQLYKTSTDIQLIGGNRNSSGWVSSGEGAKTTKSVADVVKVGTWFNLSMTVDNTAKTCVVVLSDGTNTITQTYENIFVNDSNLSMVFQTQSCLIDDLKLTATYEKALDMLGVQVTTEVSDTYGLRFSSRLRTGNISDYSAIGMTIVADYEGGSKEFVGEDTTVYLAIQGNEDGVLKSYRAKDYGAAYLFCVTIKDIPADLATITYTVTPFLKTLSGDTITFDTCTVTVVNGAVAD